MLPDAIKAWRTERSLSQMELARLAGCSEGLIAQIETGRRQPGLKNALGIAAALGVKLTAIAIVMVDLEAAAASVSQDVA